MAKEMPVSEVSLLPPRHDSLVYFRYSVCITLLITAKNGEIAAVRHLGAKITPVLGQTTLTHLDLSQRVDSLPV